MSLDIFEQIRTYPNLSELFPDWARHEVGDPHDADQHGVAGIEAASAAAKQERIKASLPRTMRADSERS